MQAKDVAGRVIINVRLRKKKKIGKRNAKDEEEKTRTRDTISRNG